MNPAVAGCQHNGHEFDMKPDRDILLPHQAIAHLAMFAHRSYPSHQSHLSAPPRLWQIRIPLPKNQKLPNEPKLRTKDHGLRTVERPGGVTALPSVAKQYQAYQGNKYFTPGDGKTIRLFGKFAKITPKMTCQIAQYDVHKSNQSNSGLGTQDFRLCNPPNICFHPLMPSVPLKAIVAHCDKILRTREIGDYDGAANGLQVQNRGTVTRVAAAVDASLSTIKLAIAARADLLIVHHGLFWSARQPWTGKNYELLRLLMENNLAVYSSHLPLDVHPILGNNVLLCHELGLKRLKPFFQSHGQTIGFKSQTRIPRLELAERLERATGTRPKIIPGGSETCRCIGAVTGGAGGELKLVAEEGVDTFITGEGPHWTFGMAEELGLNVLYGGHYATETFGVKALAAHIAQKFGIQFEFLAYPSGL